jgi:lysophospholipase L1-like esterase
MKIVSLLVFSVASVCAAAAADQTHWIGTWGASPAPQLSDAAQMAAEHLLFADQTIREIVHTSAGGNTLRVRLSNAYGKTSITVGSAHIALRDKESAIVASSDRALTFGGRPTATIPADATVLSDPIKLDVPPLSDVAISLYLPKPTTGAGIHYAAQQTSYIGKGDLSGSASFAQTATLTSWVFLTGLDVAAPENAGTIVAFGDSITDGARSTVDANRRWPNFLAERLAGKKGQTEFGVLDEGIGGNRILHDPANNVRFGANALARFTRDVIAQPGVRYLIVLEGINDIGHPGQSAPDSETVTAEDLTTALKQMVERAHEKGIKVFGATLTPFKGTTIPGYYTPEKDAKRKAVNQWIRTSGVFDGVIDFDKATQDPSDPDRIKAAYDGGDRLHPGDAGYRAMGEAIDLSLFR